MTEPGCEDWRPISGAFLSNMNKDDTSRVVDGFLHPAEDALFTWLAARMPEMFKPDLFTLLGIAGAILACAAYALAGWQISFMWVASLGLMLNWFGDSLDGTLARVRHCERPRYGFFVDQTADIISQLSIGFGVALSPFVRFDVGCIALIAYLTLAALTLVRRSASGKMQVCYGRIGPTELRCIMLFLNGYWYFHQPFRIDTPWGVMSGADIAILAGSSVALIGFCVSAVGEARKLAVQDPGPERKLPLEQSVHVQRREEPLPSIARGRLSLAYDELRETGSRRRV